MFVEDLKHNILSVSQMVDRGLEITFKYKWCIIRKEDFGTLVAKQIRTLENVYALKGSKHSHERSRVISHSHSKRSNTKL